MKISRPATYLIGICFAVGLRLINQAAVTSDYDEAPPAFPNFTESVTPAEWEQHGSAPSKFVGSESCAYCHKDGHDFPEYGIQGTEYDIWANKDRHSCAYNILFEPISVDIARNLKLPTPPHKSNLCLNCHSTNVPETQKAANHQLNLVDGVSCESCHGGAEKWLVAHKLDGWKNLSPSQKETLGFVNTDNLATRARTCVQCHVGSPGRDVNHDLIAAGHPRLYFELSAYLAKEPRHWSRTEELYQNSATAEARTWLVGQFVSAAASLDLLQQRAADESAPWPEFAEYGCFSCHHDLAAQNWKKEAGFFKLGQSKPKWGTWHFAMFERFPTTSTSFDPNSAAGDVAALRDAMQERMPERATIIELTNRIRDQFNTAADMLATTPLDEGGVLALANQLFAEQAAYESAEANLDRSIGVGTNWESLTQRYLAAAALRQSLLDSRWMSNQFSSIEFDGSKMRMEEIRDMLKFIEDRDGPAELEPAQSAAIKQGLAEIFATQLPTLPQQISQ